MTPATSNAPAKLGELTYRRVHRASPDLLFDCMTTPEHLAHFWGPRGTTTPVANFVVDLRPGGAFETTMVSDTDGSAYTMRAVYVEVRRPDLLVWSEPGSGMTTTITFTDLGDGTTEVLTHQTNVPEAYRSPEAQAGFATSLDRCDAYVASLVGAPTTESGTLTSPDGTAIGWTRTGTGPALVLVDGALCFRGAGPLGALAERLADRFTVWTYDRRGRGASGDTLPADVTREVEDLRAVVGRAGGVADVYGISSGAVLALRAAAADPGITRLALYEPPLLASVAGDGFAASSRAYGSALRATLDEGRRGDAVALFLGSIGVPEPAVADMRSGPGWAALEAIAPTLAYDDALLAGGTVPAAAAEIGVPTLVLSGGASPAVMQDAARATAAGIQGAEHRTLADQTHDVSPDALAPALAEFLAR